MSGHTLPEMAASLKEPLPCFLLNERGWGDRRESPLGPLPSEEWIRMRSIGDTQVVKAVQDRVYNTANGSQQYDRRHHVHSVYFDALNTAGKDSAPG